MESNRTVPLYVPIFYFRTNERVGKKEKKKGRAAAARPQGRRVSARKQKRRGENEDDHQAEPAELGTHFMAL